MVVIIRLPYTDIYNFYLQLCRFKMQRRRKQDIAGCTLTASILGLILLTATVVVLTVMINKHHN